MSVCSPLRLSATRWSCVKATKARITKSSLKYHHHHHHHRFILVGGWLCVLSDRVEQLNLAGETKHSLLTSAKQQRLQNNVSQQWGIIPASFMARNTENPIRKIVDGMKLTPNPDKDMIPLSIGIATIYRV